MGDGLGGVVGLDGVLVVAAMQIPVHNQSKEQEQEVARIQVLHVMDRVALGAIQKHKHQHNRVR